MSAAISQAWAQIPAPAPAAAPVSRRVRSHRRRMQGPPSEADVARMMAEFRARGGQVTVCPVAHAVPVNNGAGRDASRWTV